MQTDHFKVVPTNTYPGSKRKPSRFKPRHGVPHGRSTTRRMKIHGHLVVNRWKHPALRFAKSKEEVMKHPALRRRFEQFDSLTVKELRDVVRGMEIPVGHKLQKKNLNKARKEELILFLV